MALFELLIGLLLGGAVLTVLANRIGAPYPVLLALAGTALAIAPIYVPGVRLEPDLALTLFVAPVILDAAFDASPRDLRENWVPVTGLVLVAVALTIVAVACAARWMVPDMPWAVAVVLGAAVSPPDPVSATAILSRLSPPRRLVVILEGEGLLNDVSALLVYRLAVGVAAGGALTAGHAVPLFLLNSLGSVALGWALARLYMLIAGRIAELAISVVTQFVAIFAVWIVAEKLEVSPVLTVVVYALVLAQRTEDVQKAELRRGTFAVWEVAVYVLNALAFILVGLQLQDIGDAIPGGAIRYAGFGLGILLTVILVRFAWTFTYNALVRVYERFTLPEGERTPRSRSWKSALVVGWSGMRGLLTLAIALALPTGGAFANAEHRDLVIVAAFAVVLGTLVLQGLTLGPLLRFLALDDDGRGARERDLAREAATRAAIGALDGLDDPEAALLRKEYSVVLEDEALRHLRPKVFGKLRMRAIAAERETLGRLRRERQIGEDAFRDVEEELDWAEGNARRRGRALRLAEDEGQRR